MRRWLIARALRSGRNVRHHALVVTQTDDESTGRVNLLAMGAKLQVDSFDLV
jgi:hypothetical protein